MKSKQGVRSRPNPFDKHGIKTVRIHFSDRGGWYSQEDAGTALQLVGGGGEEPYMPPRAATDDELLFRWWATARKYKWRVHPNVVIEIVRPNPSRLQRAWKDLMRPPPDVHNPRITKWLERHKFKLVHHGGDLWNYERPLPERHRFVIATADGHAPLAFRGQTHLLLMGPHHNQPLADYNLAGVQEAIEFIQQSQYAVRIG